MDNVFGTMTYDQVLLMGSLFYWLVAGGLIGAILGSRRGKTLAGFVYGAALNVLGWYLISVVYDRYPRCFDCGKQLPVLSLGGDCPHCRTARPAGVSLPARAAARKAPVAGRLPVPPEREDIVYRLMNHHLHLRENLEYTTALPQLIKKEEQWRRFSAAEKFLQKNILEHFRLEDEVLFPWLRAAYPQQMHAALLEALRQEHDEMRQSVDEFDAVVGQSVFPLDEMQIERINTILVQLNLSILEHTRREDDVIYARISG